VTGPGLDEFALIERLFAPLAKDPGAYGLKDDAATIPSWPGEDLVITKDAMVAGIHFFDSDPPDLIARKLVRVNLSDLAAKGAVPRAYLLDLMLPKTVTENWIGEFARGLALDQEEYGVQLIGGDTDATPGPVAIAITAFGEVATGSMVRRRGARAGDAIFVTGTIGDSALGAEVLRGALAGVEPVAANFLVGRYRLPQPRAALGPRLIGLASSAIDVSDGLVADLRHVCEASGLVSIVEAARVPLSAAARTVLAASPAHLAAVLTGGDDYEILFTAPPTAADKLAPLSQALDVTITEIGRMRSPSNATEDRVTVLDHNGLLIPIRRGGWTHF